MNIARLEIGQLFTQGAKRGHPCTLDTFLVCCWMYSSYKCTWNCHSELILLLLNAWKFLMRQTSNTNLPGNTGSNKGIQKWLKFEHAGVDLKCISDVNRHEASKERQQAMKTEKALHQKMGMLFSNECSLYIRVYIYLKYSSAHISHTNQFVWGLIAEATQYAKDSFGFLLCIKDKQYLFLMENKMIKWHIKNWMQTSQLFSCALNSCKKISEILF